MRAKDFTQLTRVTTIANKSRYNRRDSKPRKLASRQIRFRSVESYRNATAGLPPRLSRRGIRFFETITKPKFRRGETGLTRDQPLPSFSSSLATFSAAFEVSSGANLIT